MPQELHVVQCYSCETFQVDIVKKVPKWSCKVCGEKQSVRKVYGKGNGKECRLFVQSLNRQRLTQPNEQLGRYDSDNHIPHQIENTSFSTENHPKQHENSSVMKKSKWNEFIQNSLQVSSVHNNLAKSSEKGDSLIHVCDNIFEDKDTDFGF